MAEIINEQATTVVEETSVAEEVSQQFDETKIMEKVESMVAQRFKDFLDQYFEPKQVAEEPKPEPKRNLDF